MKTYYKILDWFVGLFITPTLEQKAKNFAIRAHRSTNHKYDGKPYSVHLKIVIKYAKKYINLIPEDKRAIVIAACWCHDLVEDARITFSDLYKVFGSTISNIVYAVTNEKGKTRAHRANAKYYKGIRETELATFVKICDRLANIEYSVKKGSSMLSKYKQEHKHFKEMLNKDEYEVMFIEMEKIMML